MTPTPEALAKVTAVFDDSHNALTTALATASGYVLAWPTGLAIAYDANDKPFVTGVVHASVIVTEEQARTMPEEAWAYTPQIVNGAGEKAQIVPHKLAIQWALDSVAESKTLLAEMVAGA